MKPFPVILLALLAITTPAPIRAQGAAGMAARETAEFLMKRFGREALEEGVEKLTGRIAAAAAKYGDEAVETAVRKVGPRALSLADDAGEHGARVISLLSKHGDDAAWLVGRPESMQLLARYGDDAAEILIKHKAIAEPIAEKLGQPAMQALGALGPQGGRRLAMLADSGELAATGRASEVLGVVRQYGDSAMDFLWRHKAALAVGTTLAAFLQDPKPFLDGTVSLSDTVVERAIAPITTSVVEHAVAPIATAAAASAQDAAGVSVRFLSIAIPAALLCWFGWFLLAERIRRAVRIKLTEDTPDAH